MDSKLQELYSYGIGSPDFGYGEQPVISIEYRGPEFDQDLLSALRLTLTNGCRLSSLRCPDGTFTVFLESIMRTELSCTEGNAGDLDVLRTPAWTAELNKVLPRAHEQFVEVGAQRLWWVLWILAPECELVAGFRIDGGLVGITSVGPRRTEMDPG